MITIVQVHPVHSLLVLRLAPILALYYVSELRDSQDADQRSRSMDNVGVCKKARRRRGFVSLCSKESRRLSESFEVSAGLVRVGLFYV